MCLVWVYTLSIAPATSSVARLHHVSLADKKKRSVFACGIEAVGQKIRRACEVQRYLSGR